MLIAIMGDTYSKVTKNKDKNSLKTQTEFYSDFMSVLKPNKKVNTNRFLYIAVPVADVDTEADADWQGGLSKITGELESL